MNFDKECEEIKAKLEDINIRLMEYVKGYTDGYEEAAKDPGAWYLTDIDGNIIKIGERVKNGFKDKIIEVEGFGLNDRLEPLIIYQSEENGELYNGVHYLNVSKIKSEREKIKEELAGMLQGANIGEIDVFKYIELAEQFISRIEALGGE